jgi:ATP adenylyltransferase
MDRLWTPWRYSYISKAGGTPGCIFCEKAASDEDRENLVVHRAPRCFVLLNLFPYTNGHMMVAPYEHVDSLAACPEESALEMMLLARGAEEVLRKVYRPQGLNLGMNLGECAGAGVAGHIHLHVLPRWVGDANFMTSVAETRVLPESLDTTWQRLHEAFQGLS